MIINFGLTNSLLGSDSRYISQKLYVIFLFNSMRTYHIRTHTHSANGWTINILLTRFESSVISSCRLLMLLCGLWFGDSDSDSDLEDLQYNLMKATNLKSFDCVPLCVWVFFCVWLNHKNGVCNVSITHGRTQADRQAILLLFVLQKCQQYNSKETRKHVALSLSRDEELRKKQLKKVLPHCWLIYANQTDMAKHMCGTCIRL